MNGKLKALVATTASTVTSLTVLAQPAFATEWPWSGESLESIAGTFIRYVMTLGALIAIGVLVMGGISYMTSGGDKMKVQQAQSTMTSAIVGLLIVLGAYLIVKAICITGGLSGTDFCNNL
jgi:hypothetical protein